MRPAFLATYRVHVTYFPLLRTVLLANQEVILYLHWFPESSLPSPRLQETTDWPQRTMLSVPLNSLRLQKRSPPHSFPTLGLLV